MAGNSGKFIDRSPSILAAGKLTDSHGDSVRGCFKNYQTADAQSALKLVAGTKDPPQEFKPEPFKNLTRRGIFTEIRPILQPGTVTKYQTLINELKETTYKSHWDKVLGKPRDPVPGLPRGLDPLVDAFGDESNKNETMKELINPPKGVYQVLTDSQVGHELYRKSHNDYNIGEKINRNYSSPPYDSDKRFGGHSKYDPRGIMVRCACHWHKSEPVVFCSEIQSDFNEKNRPKLGGTASPNKIAEKLPKDFTFGKPVEWELYAMEDLLKDGDCPPCLFKRDFRCWMSSFNKLKEVMKKRVNKGLNLEDVCKRFMYYDVEHLNLLPLKTFYDVCACYRIEMDRKNVESLLELLRIIRDGKIDYRTFLDILDYKKPPVELIKISDIPPKNQYYATTNQASRCDYLIINNVNSPPAGIPTLRHDLERPTVPPGSCRADLESLGDETSASSVLNPSIFVNYGVSFRDFFIPRPKSVIRGLFEKVEHRLDDKSFEDLWTTAVERDKTGLVCVDTFNKLLNSHYPDQRKLVVDEATC